MINPPIDKLIKKAPCRYALVVGVAKRAKELETQEVEKEYLESTGKKSIQEAPDEVYSGEYIVKVKPAE